MHHTVLATVKHLLVGATHQVVSFVTSPAFVHHAQGLLMQTVSGLAGHHGAELHIHSNLHHLNNLHGLHLATNHASNNLHGISQNLHGFHANHLRSNGYDSRNKPH